MASLPTLWPVPSGPLSVWIGVLASTRKLVRAFSPYALAIFATSTLLLLAPYAAAQSSSNSVLSSQGKEAKDLDRALAAADSLYAIADAHHADGRYAEAISASKEALKVLFPHSEIPADVSYLESYYDTDQGRSGSLLLHLNTERIDLRLAPDALHSARQIDRSADRSFRKERSGMIRKARGSYNFDEAVERSRRAEAAYREVLGERHLHYLSVLDRHALRYSDNNLSAEAQDLRSRKQNIIDTLLGPQISVEIYNQVMAASEMESYEDIQSMMDEAAVLAAENGRVAEHLFVLAMQAIHAKNEAQATESEEEQQRYRNDRAAYSAKIQSIMEGVGWTDETLRYRLDPMFLVFIQMDAFEESIQTLKREHTLGLLTAETQPTQAAVHFQSAADQVLPLRDVLQDLTARSTPLVVSMKGIMLTLAQGAALSGVMTLATDETADSSAVASAFTVAIQHKARDFDREVKQKQALLQDDEPIVDRYYTGVQARARDVAGWTYVAPTLPDDEPEAETPAIEEPEPKKKRGRFGRFTRRVKEAARSTGQAVKGTVSAIGAASSGELLASDSLLAEYMDDLQTLKLDQFELQRQVQSRGDLPPTEAEPGIRDVAARLPEDAILVDIVRFYPYDFPLLREAVERDTSSWAALEPGAFSVSERYAAFVLDSSGSHRLVDLGTAAAIDSLVKLYRKDIENFNPRTMGRRQQERASRELGTLTQQVFDRVIKPLGLPATGRVFLSPDGLLRILPFETIQDTEGTYLIDRYEFTYLASARSLLDVPVRAEEAPRQTASTNVEPMYVFGSIDYGEYSPRMRTTSGANGGTDTVEDTAWRPLVQTREEVDFIQAEMDVAAESVFRDGHATESRLLETRSPRRMHVATHGFFFESQIAWMFDMETLASLGDVFYQRLLPETAARQSEEKPEDDETSVGQRVFGSVVPGGQTILTARRKALRFEERMNALNAFLDDVENLPKRAAEVKMDVIRWSDPLVRSGLVMADRNRYVSERSAFDGDRFFEFTGTEDGLVTAYEISWMDLQNTEVVVLSACETGLGDIINGEGVYGLGRSFQTAGARSVVMSLWQVDDTATRDLMKTFYGGIDAGERLPSALRSAAQSVKDERPHPYFWGAFIPMGHVN